MSSFIVPDSNIFIKLLVPEHDAEQAFQFCHACLEQNIRFIVPELFRYEVTQVAYSKGCAITTIIELLQSYEDNGLICQPPKPPTWIRAGQMIDAAHPKSGYPSMYDTIYHALAIEKKTVFITADKRHYEKCKSFGHIALLHDWQDALTTIQTQPRHLN